MLTEESRSARRNTCPSATLFTTNLPCTGLLLNSGFLSERSATDRLNHGAATNWESTRAYLTDSSRSPLRMTAMTRDLN
jgi:hypothetical protein